MGSLFRLPKDLVDLNAPALAGQADLAGAPSHQPAAGRVGCRGCGVPSASQGLSHASPGQSWTTTVAVPSRAAPDPARGWADARPTGRPTTPACKIKTSGRRWAVERQEVLRNPEK